jgi:NAD(P) transhydrogenase subunit alpha
LGKLRRAAGAVYICQMKVAAVKETFPGERRVALVPADVAKLVKNGLEVILEQGAGDRAGFNDQAYLDRGAKIAATRAEAQAADILVQVRCTLSPEAARTGQTVVGLCSPLDEPQAVAGFARSGATLFALELIPRTTRAQSMDVLSSMTTLAGYRAVLLAAVELPKIFPLMMTAAGTLTAARVFVIGVGVAGLSAIATAKRLGGVVRAYDVRPACREQVESLGAKFVELPIETKQAETAGGMPRPRTRRFTSGSASYWPMSWLKATP